MRNYLKLQDISTDKAKLIFQFRTRMIQVKLNYKNNNLNNLICPCCKKKEDDQVHLIFCESLTNTSVSLSEYKALFGNADESIKEVITKMEILISQRNDIIDSNNIKQVG